MMPSRQLADAAARLQQDFGMTPWAAGEIEFYLSPAPPFLLPLIDAALQGAGITAHSVERERGEGQMEVALHPTSDMARAAQEIQTLRTVVTALARRHDAAATFAAKPFPDQPGSGLHMHISLHNEHGTNCFMRQEDESYCPALRHAIGGLLARMRGDLPVFVPTDASRARLIPKANAPLTVSWGPNNRTVAIRLPQKPLNNKHLEHRVAGADADPVLVLTAILRAIHHGLAQKIEPPAPVHGDANDPQYGLPRLLED